jgi:hypothetical protein
VVIRLTKEDEFWNFIQSESAKLGSAFFLSSGEGRDFETETMKGEDYFGWLIPLEKVNKFRCDSRQESLLDNWNKYLKFVIWEKNDDKISVEFKSF